MFYICKGCGDGCRGCCKVCDDSCKGCSQIFDPICKVLDRPLGGYVFMTWLFNIPVAILCLVSLLNSKVTACSAKPLTIYLIVDLILAVSHAGFALYFQLRLVKGLQTVSQDSHHPASEQLMKRAWDIVLYDFGFCIYIFVFIASFGFNVYAISWASACNTGTPMPFMAGLLLILFAFIGVNFAILWYCSLVCTSCCNGLLGSRASASGQNQGFSRFILGKNAGYTDQTGYTAQSQPTAMGQPVMGRPVQGYPVQQPVPPGQQAMPQQAMYQGQGQAQQAAQPPPSAASQAAAVAGSGLGMAGQGLQALGGWLGGGKKAQPTR